MGTLPRYERFKRIQDLAAKIWAGGIAVLGAIIRSISPTEGRETQGSVMNCRRLMGSPLHKAQLGPTEGKSRILCAAKASLTLQAAKTREK